MTVHGVVKGALIVKLTDDQIDNEGNAVAVWRQNNGTLGSVWANTYTPGSGWGTAELTETVDFTLDYPILP